MNNRLYLSPPHLSGREQEFVGKAIASNWIAPLGPDVDAFEKEIASYTGAVNAVALSSGTAAIHLALINLGIGAGDEVICSSFTFAGSCNPVRYCGATPVFVDSEEKSWNMGHDLLDEAIRDRIAVTGKPPKVCIVVHLYGMPADMTGVMEVCARHGVTVIEDAAESLGAYAGKKHTGTIAAYGILSFNGNKIITTSGGGMLLCHDKAFADRARFLATQARDPAPHYEHTHIGYNYRMSNIVAAVGRGQLTVIEERVKRRHEIFEWYRKRFCTVPGITFMPDPGYGRGNRWLTCLVVDPSKTNGVDREKIRLALEAENIESRPLWKPMHLQPVFKDCPAYVNGVSERLFKDGLCLPSGTAMTGEDLERVAGVVERVLGPSCR